MKTKTVSIYIFSKIHSRVQEKRPPSIKMHQRIHRDTEAALEKGASRNWRTWHGALAH